jgi:TPR repeat protein
MYAHGQGVEKDRVQAFLWLSLAAQHGIGTALNALDDVVKHMSSEEKAEAMRLFDEWRGRTASNVGPGRIEPLPG